MSANPRISLVNTYNEQGELIRAGSKRFAYDAAGNPLHRKGLYHPQTHALTEDALATYVCDPNGALIRITHAHTPEEERFTWNALGQLIRYTRTKNETLTEELAYTYDPLGRRASKTHTTQEATTTHRYLYDDHNIVAILNEEQELLATILHHPDKTDTPLAITNHQTQQTYYYHRDHQGSIIALTNEEGQIVERITYDGHFGEIMEHTKHEITHNPYGYTGREMDTPRLYYYRARYYSPILRRFLSPDPIEHASGDYNWYRYVGNDPVNRVDPSGLDFVTPMDNDVTASYDQVMHNIRASHNWVYLSDWITGKGPRIRIYDQDTLETQEMMRSKGADKLRKRFYERGCVSFKNGSYSTYQAFVDTIGDMDNTAFEVGGFGGASVINNGNGTATYTIPNTSGVHSFFYHILPDRKSKIGMMSNIKQKFTWTEKYEKCMCK